MKLEARDEISAPLAEVFQLTKNEIVKIVPYLPNIEKIEVISRKDLGGGKTEVLNNWYAKAEIPGLIKKFVSPDLLSWVDSAVWDDATTSVTYSIDSKVAKSLFEARGKNTFKDAGNGKTILTIDLDFNIHPERLPGVPRLLAGTVKPVIEELLKGMIAPNMLSLAKGLNEYYKKLNG